MELALVGVKMGADFNVVARMRFECIGVGDLPRFIVLVRHEHYFFAVNFHRTLKGLERGTLR